MRKRVVLTHLSRACPVVDLPVYGTLSQLGLPPRVNFAIIVSVVFLKFLVIITEYNASKASK